MKKSIFLILILVAALINCSKKREEKFPAPLVLFVLTPSQTYEVIKAPKAGASVLGKVTAKDKITAIGTYVIVEKKGDQKFLQIQCPNNFTCEKEGAYISLNLVNISGCAECASSGDPGLSGILLPPESIEKATLTRDWILNPKKQIPDSLDENIVLTCLNVIKNDRERNLRTMELNILFTALKEPSKLKDAKLEALRSKYSAIDGIFKIFKEGDGSGWENDPLSKVQIPESLASQIKKTSDENRQSIVTGFPFRGDNWAVLVREFSILKSTIYAQEKIFAETIKNAQFEITAPSGTINISDVKVDIRELEGSFLNISGTDTEILGITAESEKTGLIFKVKIADGEIVFKPTEIPPYLALGGPGFKQFLSQIPSDYNKIREGNSFNRAFMLTLLKFGTGEYNSNTGRMEYSINLPEKENYYWMMYNLVKTSPKIELTNNGHTGNFKYGASFRQPAGEFIVAYDAFCDGPGCGKPEKQEETCFSKNNGTFSVVFAPSEINKEKPYIQIFLGGPEEATAQYYATDCKTIINTLTE